MRRLIALASVAVLTLLGFVGIGEPAQGKVFGSNASSRFYASTPEG